MDGALRQEMLGLMPRLRRYAYGLTGNHADGDDLLQKTYERALEHLGIFSFEYRTTIRSASSQGRCRTAYSYRNGDFSDADIAIGERAKKIPQSQMGAVQPAK